MTRALLLCAVVMIGVAGGLAARRRHRPPSPVRSIQRRAGSPFTGDLHQNFEDYLASQGVSFDSLFEEPSDLRSEGEPARRRTSPTAGAFDDFQRRPAAPYSAFPPASRPERPQTFLYSDRPSLSYGDLSQSRRTPARDRPAPEAPEPVVRRVAVQRPQQRPRRPVVQLRPAPSPPLPSLDIAQAAAQRSQVPATRRDYVAPYPEQEGPLPPVYDNSQDTASPRQDGYSLNIPEKKEKQRLEFQVHGQEGPHSYRFGYDTGTGYNRQFRFEERDGYGNTKGRYGFYDKSGKLQVVNYSASPDGGFHAEGDFGKYPNAGH